MFELPGEIRETILVAGGLSPWIFLGLFLLTLGRSASLDKSRPRSEHFGQAIERGNRRVGWMDVGEPAQRAFWSSAFVLFSGEERRRKDPALTILIYLARLALLIALASTALTLLQPL